MLITHMSTLCHRLMEKQAQQGGEDIKIKKPPRAKGGF